MKSARLALISLKQVTTLAFETGHSIAGKIPVVIPTAFRTLHFSLSSGDVVHQFEIVELEHTSIGAGIGRTAREKIQ